MIADLVSDAPVVQMSDSSSVGSKKLTREFMNYTFTIDSPRNRLPSPSAIPGAFSLLTAAARFVWMMAGSDRLDSISHYSDRVKRFSDDEFVVPGSSYGARLFYARPGLDQITNVVETLKKDPSSRRAMATIFQPEDTARRESSDIPCTYGLSFLVREEQLHATTIMRSNNAWLLLPYNIFEFTLLAEIVACRVGVPLGSYTHHCISLHLYEDDFGAAEEWLSQDHDEAIPMEGIDDLLTFQKVKALLKFEEQTRADYVKINSSTIGGWTNEAKKMGSTLTDLAVLLLIKSARRADRSIAADRLIESLTPNLQQYVPTMRSPQLQLPLG